MAGTSSVTRRTFIEDRRVEKIIFTFTADASDGSIPSVATAEKVIGKAVLGVTIPGDTGPTPLYDIVINDDDGLDIFGGQLTNRSATTDEQAVPLVGGAYAERMVASKLTMVITNNSVNSATGTVIVYVIKP